MLGVLPSRRDLILGPADPSFPLVGPHVYLNREEQNYHATVWGQSGSGKSKLLESLFLQIHRKRGGAAIIEPHHDLSFDTLSFLVGDGYFDDPRAFEQLIYLDWGNGHYVPFNVLAGEGDPHTIASNALEGMIRAFPDLEQGAPLFRQTFLSALMILIANNLPITFLYRVLTDEGFRHAKIAQVEDRLVHQVFARYDRLGRDQMQEAGSTLRRAFLLTFSPLTRMTLGQPENWLNFREIMDSGKSVIINLGNVHDLESRKLLGAMLLVQIEQAALSRTDIPPAKRRDFTLLIDEWPSFAAQADTLGTMLSQCRKFKLRLYLAAQSLAQVSSDRLLGAIENCRITVAFGLGRDSAERQARLIGSADAFAIKEEPLTETQHSQYLSIQEQFESWTGELQNLPPRTAYLKVGSQSSVRFKTLTVAAPPYDERQMGAVLERYRGQYQRSPEETRQVLASIEDPLETAPGSGRDDHFSKPAPPPVRFGRRVIEEVA